MRELGLAGTCRCRNLGKNSLEHRIFPCLLRRASSSYPNHVWGIDITYIRLHAGWIYLVSVLDWFSRYVVSWGLDQTLEMVFVVGAVERAFAQATPRIWNSDQGSHFTSPQYTYRLLAANVQISTNGRSRAMDDIFTERLWRTLKYEEIYLRDYGNPREARQSLTRCFVFSNHERPHQALSYEAPAQIYFARDEAHASPYPATLPTQNVYSTPKGPTLPQGLFGS